MTGIAEHAGARSGWTNWAGSAQCFPARRISLRSEDELVQQVRDACSTGQPLRVAGNGHSFAPLVSTDSTLVDLHEYDDVIAVDPAAMTVTVQAGAPLWRINAELDRYGLALENMGTVNVQTAAGLVATGTHGSGIRYGCLSSQVASMRLVTGRGEVVECSASTEPEVFSAARLGLGALGVISTVTFRCVPAFSLGLEERTEPFARLVERLPEHVESIDHPIFFWPMWSDQVHIRAMSRTTAPLRPSSRWQAWRDHYLAGHVGLQGVLWAHRRDAALVPFASKVLTRRPLRSFVDMSHRVFTFPQHVRVVSMEYAVPFEALGQALQELRRALPLSGEVVSLPLEIRVAPGNDIPLSPSYGRLTGYVNLATDAHSPHDKIYQVAERVLGDFDGRPHWAKLHSQTASSLAPRYPRWNDVQRIRQSLDPEGILINPYLERVFTGTA
ncbi:D-arabinono-1,4-lactone oxidase [Saccharopolyspora sp. NPDC000995]